MGDLINRVHIKNSGEVIVFVTFFCGIWYTLLHLQKPYIGAENEVLFRIIGVFIVAVFSYTPYFFLYYFFDKISYTSFVTGCFFTLFLCDIVLRVATIFGAFDHYGLLMVFGFSFFMLINLGAVLIVTYLVDRAIDRGDIFANYWSTAKKIISSFLHRRIL